MSEKREEGAVVVFFPRGTATLDCCPGPRPGKEARRKRGFVRPAQKELTLPRGESV